MRLSQSFLYSVLFPHGDFYFCEIERNKNGIMQFYSLKCHRRLLLSRYLTFPFCHRIRSRMKYDNKNDKKISEIRFTICAVATEDVTSVRSRDFGLSGVRNKK